MIQFLRPRFVRNMIGRRQVDEELRQHSYLLESVFECVHVLIAYMDKDFNFLRVNHAYAAADGRQPDYFIGKNHFALYPNPENEAIFRKVVETGKPYVAQGQPFAYREAPERGVSFWDWRVEPVKNPKGEIQGVILSLLDVTPRILAARALDGSETRYRNLFENMADGYALHEIKLGSDGEPHDYRYLEVNPAFERILGIKREQVIGRTLREIFPDIESYWLETLGRVATTGRPARLEQYSCSHGRHFAITVSRPERGLVAVFLSDVTARRNAERALRDSEARLNQAQRLAHIGSWELNLVDNRLFWSDEIYRISEIDPTRFGASFSAFLQVVHPDDRAAVEFAYKNSLKTRTPYSIDHRLLFPDGRIKYVHEQCETIYEDDRPVRSLGTVQDITERKHAERVLLESEARFRMQYKGFPIPTYTWRKRGRDFLLLEFNDAASDITRGRVQQLLGKTVHELYPDRPDIAEDMWRCIRGESPLRREGLFRIHSTGEEKDFVITYVALPPDLVMVHTEDVMERRRAEDKLRQAAIVFESTLEGVMITDCDRNIVAVNKAFTDITGYAANEALGKNPRFLQSGRQDMDFYRALWASLERSGQWRGEVWNRRKNGEIFPVWENISAVRDETGQAVNYIAVFSDISVIKNHEERMTHLAHHDALTGLPNRLLFSANLDQALELAKRHGGSIALMFMDLDRFKMINDTLGHTVGDRLLQAVAQRLKRCVRAEDTVARLGGDEFTVIVNDVSHLEDAAMLAEKLIAAFEAPIVIDGYEMKVGVSIGISVFPEDGSDSDGLTKAADAALYRAKERGRNTYEFYTPELTACALEHLAMEQALRAALAREEFELYYQPEVDLSTGEITRVEALLRWRHPKLGLLEPEHFMAVAEDSGLIEPIGEWVFRTACEQAVRWRAAGLSGRMAINLSGRQVIRAGLVDKVAAILRETGAQSAGAELELEITESVLHRVEQSRSVLEQLKRLGVRLAVDDFGAGYSSLAHLRHLPIDTLKIDRSFVEDVPRNPDAASIVEAIITLGHGLRLTVVGEGVETTAQQNFLRALRCDQVQGHLYGRAVPVDAIEKLLAAGRVTLH